jgi:PAS domain S-box-containing protein
MSKPEEVKRLVEELSNLKKIKILLEAIINSTQDAISVVDEKGIEIMINPEYTRLTGLSEDDVIGKSATVDIAEGESMHLKVLKTKRPVNDVRMKVGPARKDVIVDVAPILVDEQLKGSVAVIHDVSRIKKLTDELDHVRRLIRHLNAKYSFDDIIGVSDTIKAVIKQAKKASRTPVTVMLRGESGTGKELFAHAIHNASPRREKKFVRISCSALVDNILESELFGYEEGAFTGAKKGGKKGLFEEADGGTIFLDEIGKMSLNLQSKLLRVLQEKEIIRVGGTTPVEIDARVIVATNINLERAIQEGIFREDLYYRLNVFPLFLPTLRERLEDIPHLVKHIIQRFNQEYGRSVKGISEYALEILKKYDWPGNVRELENIIGRAMINLGLERDLIEPKHLPLLGNNRDVFKNKGFDLNQFDLDNHSLKEIINTTEKRAIIQALKETDDNKTEAAKIMGIAIRSLYYKLDKYGIE